MHILFISTTIPYIYIYHVSLCHNCIVVKSSEVPIFLMVQRRIESDSSGEFSWSCRGPWRPRLPGVVREGIGASTSALAPLFWFSHGPISDFGELEELEKLVFWASKRRDCNIQHGENEVLRCSKISDGMVYCPRLGPGAHFDGENGRTTIRMGFRIQPTMGLESTTKGPPHPGR